MLRVLLAKDLCRAWRNPLPWLINLIVPLTMTALIGLVFGGNSGGGLGTIKLAVVNENNSRWSEFLRRAGNSMKGENSSRIQLDPVFTNRVEAMRLINANQISAVLVIPTNFLSDYLLGEKVSLELVKNPAESVHPAVIEEGLGALVTAMNAVSRNFQSEFPAWHEVFTGDRDYRAVTALVDRAGDRLKAAKDYLDPPLVFYTKASPEDETNSVAATNAAAKKDDSGSSIFAYLLIGLSAMFLLFLAGNAMNDLYRELRQRTFERYQTLRDSLLPFLTSKVAFAVVMLMLCSAMMLGGGGLIFRIHWAHPGALLVMVLGYACFAAAFYAVIVAVMPDERRSAVLSNLAGMGLGLMGGCAFPPQQLPVFLRENITTHLPSYWFVDTLRNLQYGGTDVAWGMSFLKLIVVSAALLLLAATMFRRKFKSGLRA